MKMAVVGSSDNLAIVPEKRTTHRPGGCVGVFIQFFDWNRRLAKRKLFSRKLLPSDRSSKTTSKSSRVEKTSVTKPLIGDENKIKSDKIERSSVSIPEKEKASSVPGLVARLMGLDSMPATSRHGKPKKAVNSVPKLNLGPQKPRKTSLFDRRKCSEAMMARSSKPNQRLIPAIKSPKVVGRRSSTRLMEAASKILEPGLQSRNRSRYSLKYSSPLTEEKSSVCSKFIGSCHNCGNLVQVPDGEPSSSSSSYSSSDLSSVSSHIGCSRERNRGVDYPVEVKPRNLRHAPPSAASSSSVGRSTLSRARSSKAMDIHVSKNRASNIINDHLMHSLSKKKLPHIYGNSSGVSWARKNISEPAFLSEPSSETESRGKVSLSKGLLDQRINTLSILLGQKIRELTCPDPDPSTSTAAVVLEELISALSVAALPSPSNDPKVLPKRSKISPIPRLREEVYPRILRHPGTGGFEQESPMSILESSFFSETCLSESYNSSSCRQAQNGIAASSIDDSRSWDIDTDFSDSGRSTTIRVPGRSNDSYTWEIISKVELLFKGMCPIIPLIMQTLETTPHDPRIRRFLFDAMIEYLDSKYTNFASAGFRTWSKLPSLGLQELRLELCNKIRLHGFYPRKDKTLVEMMEEDMGEVNGSWVDFHVEAFEWGVDLEDELLSIMVSEIVLELGSKKVRRSDLSLY